MTTIESDDQKYVLQIELAEWCIEVVEDQDMEPKQRVKLVCFITLGIGWFFLVSSPLIKTLNALDPNPEHTLSHLILAVFPTIGWTYIGLTTPNTSD